MPEHSARFGYNEMWAIGDFAQANAAPALQWGIEWTGPISVVTSVGTHQYNENRRFEVTEYRQE